MKHITFRTCTILILSVLISVSEYFRNDFYYKTEWMSYYNKLQMIAPFEERITLTALIWSLLYSSFIYILSGRYGFIQTLTTISFAGISLQWLTLGDADIDSLKTILSTLPLFLCETVLIVSLAFLFRKWELNHLQRT